MADGREFWHFVKYYTRKIPEYLKLTSFLQMMKLHNRSIDI